MTPVTPKGLVVSQRKDSHPRPRYQSNAMNCRGLLIGTWVTPKQFHCRKSTIFQNFLWNWKKIMHSEGGRQVGGRACLVRGQWNPHELLLCGHGKPDLRISWREGVIMLWPKDRGSHAMLRGPCSILWVLCSSDGASLTSVRKISAAPKPMWDEGGPPAAHAGSDKILLS